MTLFAVCAQTLRTAGQKRLTDRLQPITVTFARYLFGLPIVAIYFFFLVKFSGSTAITFSYVFMIFVGIAALFQIAATILMLELFKLRNFAIGVTYVRSETFLTAIVGALLFGEFIDRGGWIAIILSMVGILILNRKHAALERAKAMNWLWNRSAALGLGSGLLFALTSLSIRKASLSLGDINYLYQACVTLLSMIIVQVILMGVYLLVRNPEQLSGLAKEWKLSGFIGMTSAFGSIGWFSAMTLEKAALVKALGQLELILALIISRSFFRERMNYLEAIGMGLTAAGITWLLLSR